MNYVPAVLVLMLIYVTSMLGLTTPQQQEWYLYYTTFFFGVHVLLLLAYHKAWNKSTLGFLGAIVSTGVLVELLASKVGLYGVNYNYGSSLEDSFCGSIAMMAVIWLIIIYSSTSLAAKLAVLNIQNNFIKAGLSGLLTLILAILFQQIASPLSLWYLDFSVIYYAIWFLAGAGFQLLFQHLKVDYYNKMSVYIYGGLLVFIVGIIFFLRV